MALSFSTKVFLYKGFTVITPLSNQDTYKMHSLGNIGTVNALKKRSLLRVIFASNSVILFYHFMKL